MYMDFFYYQTFSLHNTFSEHAVPVTDLLSIIVLTGVSPYIVKTWQEQPDYHKLVKQLSLGNMKLEWVNSFTYVSFRAFIEF